jgi:hypothetical protein
MQEQKGPFLSGPFRWLSAASASRLFAVLLGVMFSRFFRMVSGMKVMAMSYVRLVARLFVIACFMVFCRFSMMVRRLLVMLGCLAMVFRALMRHSLISFSS